MSSTNLRTTQIPLKVPSSVDIVHSLQLKKRKKKDEDEDEISDQ